MTQTLSDRAVRRLFALVPLVVFSVASHASDCSQTSVNRVPIDELGENLYLAEFQGGLYPGGSNKMPAAHAAEGVARAEAIESLDTQGAPDPDGRYVFLSIGMSNTTQEFCSQNSAFPCDPWTFMGRALASPEVNHHELAIVNGAAGGQAAATWDSPADANYDRVRDTRLLPSGLSEAQVQAVWIKVANPQPSASLPSDDADAYTLLWQLGNIVRAVNERYPNVRIIFLSSRIYAGYASTQLNPEPYAYESAFAVKWLIQAQINQMAGKGIDPVAGDLNYAKGGALLAWGPYLWADGLIPRSDGLIWQCSDMQNDGTHPAAPGEQKVGTMLLDFMLNSPLAAPWFREQAPGDINGDSFVDVNDLLLVINNWGPCLAPPPPPDNCPADVATPFGLVNVDDLLVVISNWG